MKWLLFFCLLLLGDNQHQIDIIYQIDASSKLSLNGKTSISSYECFCKDEFQPVALKGLWNKDNGVLVFNNAFLNIKAEKLSCKNRLMNRDMHKALKAETYPYIQMHLLDVTPLTKPLPGGEVKGWNNYIANVILTIAGIPKRTQLRIQAHKASPTMYRFIASKELLMSDFDVKPKTPFGLVKVEDQVTINFDLCITIREPN
mgnify:CR=1 FL=1